MLEEVTSPGGASRDSTRTVRLLVGRALRVAVGAPLTVDRRPSALRDLLLDRREDAAPDQWVILGAFEGDRRSRDTWRSASGLTLDLDWEDPTVPKEEGAHQAIPSDAHGRILEALKQYLVPGLAYLTPRGLRVMHVLAEEVKDDDSYGQFADAASEKLLRHLGEWGVPLWRSGVTGLRFDDASRLPWQAMRLPLGGGPVLLTGRDCEVCETDLALFGAVRLDLDLALPTEFADACQQIGRWVQIAPEVVVTGLMAWVCAAIGNTRWVEVRGLKAPLSLHYVTILPAGSGKGTVRGYLRRATKKIEEEILGHRLAARLAREEYEDRLAKWNADGRSVKRCDARGPRPEPPKPSVDGGERVSFVVGEGNLEGIIATMEDSPRGFLWAADEAQEVLGMLGRYGDGKGARSLDAARLRCLMDSAPVEAHRARSNTSPIRRIPCPWLALDMDVQPEVVDSIFTGEDRVSGLLARLLLHAPPPTQGTRRYVDAPPEPGPEVLDLLAKRLHALWRNEIALEKGVPSPAQLTLSEAAELSWAQELERFELLYSSARSEEFGALGHARGRLLRLAGVLALLRDPETMVVSDLDMRRAIEHLRYHLAHLKELVARGAESAAAKRLAPLRDQARRLFDQQPKVGVRPTDLARHVSKARYRGADGLRRAYADLHSLGWLLRRPKRPEGKPGRPPVPAFFPPASESRTQATPGDQSPKPHKPSGTGLGGLGDGRSGVARMNDGDARDILERASHHLLATGDVTLPSAGIRVACPACGSPDGLGTLPDNETQWYCHSDRHDGSRSGCAVDYLIAGRIGRMPSVREAVDEAKRILGEAKA